jgi:hypothetical protein
LIISTHSKDELPKNEKNVLLVKLNGTLKSLDPASQREKVLILLLLPLFNIVVHESYT